MIRTEKLSFKIDQFQLHQVSLEVPRGQYFVLLGPPGSGKSIFLECLCGLRRVDSGRIHIDGRDVTDTQPRARGTGYVPQDYALFPHLSVERNIGFGLRVHRLNSTQITQKVTETAEMLEIEHLLKRSIAGLSGGEKQRVVLARALVFQPKVLLLDEPVCALDEATRQQTCTLLHRIQRQLNLTTIHVSHNLEEAFSVADRAGILRNGALEQVGSLDELVRKPQSRFAARFTRCENLFSGQVVETDLKTSYTKIKTGEIQLLIPGQHSGKITFMIRPENVLICPEQQHDTKSENRFKISSISYRDYGGYVKVQINGRLNLVAHLPHTVAAELKAKANLPLCVELRPENIHVLPK